MSAALLPYPKTARHGDIRAADRLGCRRPRSESKFVRSLLGEAACRQLGICPIPPGFKLSVVIPVYNERAWLPEVLRRVRAVPIPKEIIIVDDCSTDGTRDMLRELEDDRRPSRPLPAGQPGQGRGPPRRPSRTPPATWSSCRTPTWNTTRPSIRG